MDPILILLLRVVEILSFFCHIIFCGILIYIYSIL